MQHTLEARKKDGSLVTLTLQVLTAENIDEILNLQNEVINLIEDKQIYLASTRDDLLHHFKNGSVILGYVTPSQELISLVIYLKEGYNDSNYGYDIGIEGESLLNIGQIDTVLVKPDYRGNNLQYIMCHLIEDIARETNTSMLCATASPFNPFSVNNLLKLGYEIKADKLKYGGLRRYVLAKSLK